MDDIHNLFAKETNEKWIWMEIGPLSESHEVESRPLRPRPRLFP